MILTYDFRYEHMLTRLLYLGNVMVISAATRRGAYWHLIETCLYTPKYMKHIEAILRNVGDSLGLASLSQLFKSYASQMAYSILRAGQDFLRLPPRLLGYDDRRACAQATFRAFTPTNTLPEEDASLQGHGKTLFKNHCTAIQITPADGIRECFAEIIGYQIVHWLYHNNDSAPVFSDELEAMLRERTYTIGNSDEFDSLLISNADSIVVAILRTLADQDLSEEGDLIKALRRWDATGNSADHFKSMAKYQETDQLHIHAPNLPAFGTDTVLRALYCLNQRIPQLDSPALTYHVLHQLLFEVIESPFVHEQLRTLNAIALHVAIRSHHFKEYTLLRTLLNGAATLLQQADLSRAAQSILEWGLHRYRYERGKHRYLPDILIRVACAAHDFSQDKADNTLASMGAQLMRWLEAEVLELRKDRTLSVDITRALSAWPCELSQDLKSLCKSVKPNEFSSVLNDQNISSNKFRLVKNFRDLALIGGYNAEHFASDFWRLKDYIPSSSQIRDDDIDAFASILLLQKGKISSFGNDQQQSHSVRTRHLSNVGRKDSTADASCSQAHEPIIFSLLAMLHGSQLDQVYLAYSTLRSLVSVYDFRSQVSLISEHDELILLHAYPKSIIAPTQQLAENAFTSQDALDMSSSFTQWITHITTALCNTLSQDDIFFVPVASLLPSIPAFSEQLLPVLTHAALQADRTISQQDKPTLKLLLSNYFTSIMMNQYPDNLCLRAIVDIVLHLRYFAPDNRDPLAYNKWLDIDYVLLSRSALTCGAYTTALLFLELAADAHEAPNQETNEQILFDIYSNLDEPDGFYGIRTNDLRQFLIRRLHHEKQWNKAFSFHGAVLASNSTDLTASTGMIEALHSFGFDRLAMNMVGTTFDANDRDNASVTYELGWRSEIWDLPEITSTHDRASSIYQVLRASHRERSAKAVEQVIREALRIELRNLKALGSESFIQIRHTLRNIMCLHQAKKWHSTDIQSLLQNKRVPEKESLDFSYIEPGFEYVL